MFKNSNSKVRFAETSFLPHESSVKPHLAYDIREIDALTKQGRPISVQSVESMFYDGQENCFPNAPLDSQRGININDVWLASKNAQEKLSKSKIKSVQINPLNT